jgi:phage FluMu gp28-like protein
MPLTEDIDPERLLDEPAYFVEHYIGEEAFDYQQEFMNASNDRKAFVSGRRVGKSRTAGWLALWKAATFAGAEVLVTAKAQRQSMEMFNQISKEIKNSRASRDQWGVVNETRTEIQFDNGSRILALPVGRDGSNIRGYGGQDNMIIVDEAAFIDDEIFQQVFSPMMAVGDGDFILLSTPFGKKGFLYERFKEDEWYTVQVPTSANPLVDDSFIEEQRRNLTNTQFKQEILGQFVESADSFFTRDELMSCAFEDVERTSDITYLGVDLASSGKDESVYVCIDDDGNVFHIEHTSEKPMTDAMGRIRELDMYYDFNKVVIDSTSLGQGVVDQVKESLGNKVKGFKFTNPKKQDLYNTLKNALQNKSLAFEYIPGKDDQPGNKMVDQCLELERSFTSGGRMKIEHPPNKHDDFSDALALAVWARSRKNIARSDKESMKPFTLGSLRE